MSAHGDVSCRLDSENVYKYNSRMGKRLQHQLPSEQPKSKTTEKPTAADELREALTSPTPRGTDMVHVRVTMKLAFARVLDTEAQYMGLRRSQLFELLFLSDAGEEVVIKRPNVLPPYKFTKNDFEKTQGLLVTLRPKVKERFDIFLDRRGLSPSTWCAGALIRWADLTAALDAVK